MTKIQDDPKSDIRELALNHIPWYVPESLHRAYLLVDSFFIEQRIKRYEMQYDECVAAIQACREDWFEPRIVVNPGGPYVHFGRYYGRDIGEAIVEITADLSQSEEITGFQVLGRGQIIGRIGYRINPTRKEEATLIIYDDSRVPGYAIVAYSSPRALSQVRSIVEIIEKHATKSPEG